MQEYSGGGGGGSTEEEEERVEGAKTKLLIALVFLGSILTKTKQAPDTTATVTVQSVTARQLMKDVSGV